MPSWKKIIVSGSNAELNQLTATSYGGNISGSSTSTGSFGTLRIDGGVIDFDNANNTFIGKNSKSSAINGADSNTVVGTNAGSVLTSGDDNTLIGYNAGNDLTSGVQNTLIGYTAGDNLTTQSGNILIGKNAGNTGHQLNVLIGNDAGRLITAGNGTVGIGHNTLYSLDTGNSNTVVGYESMRAEVDGDRSTAFGYQTLRSQTGTDGTVGSTAIGYKAGYNATSGIHNIFVGADANPSSGSANNEIVIGYGVTGLGDNQTVIGNSSQTHVVFGGDALISGSAQSTGSFGKLLGDGSSLTGIDTDLLADTTPQLGGNLDLNSNNITGTGNIDILGTITAQNFIVSSSVTSIEYQSISGSTIFGDTVDDTHTFLGNTISGSATSTGSFGSVMQNGKHFPQVNSKGESFAFGTNAGSAFVGGNANKINIAIGSNAGTAMADFGGNVYIGKNAAKLRTRGDSNVAIGDGAGGIDGDDFGDKNVFIGLSTGTNINSIHADSNVFIGNAAGNAGQQSISNVLIGDRAGNTLTDSRDNVAIGTQAGLGRSGITATTLENCIYLGRGAAADAADSNNEIVIGTFTTGHGTDTITFGDNQITDVHFASGSSTGATIHGIKDFAGNISGSATSTGSFGHLLVNGSTVGGSDSFSDGTATSMSGSATSTGSFGHLILGNRDTDASFEFGRVHIGYIGHSDMAGFSHVDLNAPTTFALAQSSAGKTIVQAKSGQPIAFKINNSDKVQISSDGNLGVGIETATEKLHVVGNSLITGDVTIGGDLTINGDTTTISTSNILVQDAFGFFATGSAGTNVDAGIIVQSGSFVDSGSALYHDISSERWSVGKGIASTATNVPDSKWGGFVATVYTASASPVGSSPKYGVGEIHVDDDGEIYIYS